MHEMTQHTNAFGELIKHYREARGWSLRELEAASGMSAANLSRIERAVVPPPAAEVIASIADALEVPVDQLRRAAGLASVTSGAEAVALEEAIVADTSLNDDERQFLLEALRFIRSRP